jgi:hypothetical protein
VSEAIVLDRIDNRGALAPERRREERPLLNSLGEITGGEKLANLKFPPAN